MKPSKHLLILLFIVGCSQEAQQPAGLQEKLPPAEEPATLLLTNAYVYTVDDSLSVAQAVAIRGNEIVHVGSSAEANRFIGNNTNVYDLDGRMLMPGLHDMHIHATGVVEPDMCDFKGEAKSLEEMVPFLKGCIENYRIAEGDWLVVLQWPFSSGNQPSERLKTIRAALDHPDAYGKPESIRMFTETHGYHPAQCITSSGVLEHSEEYIREYVRQMTAAGFHVHIHALSDRGVRVATDAFSEVKREAGAKSLTQSITHVQLAHSDDVRRIGALGIFVAFTYVWIFPDVEYDTVVVPFIDQVDGIAEGIIFITQGDGLIRTYSWFTRMKCETFVHMEQIKIRDLHIETGDGTAYISEDRGR